MKTRISALIDCDLYDSFKEYAPEYHKSKILESLLIKYLEDGKIGDMVKSRHRYACSFTIEREVWDSFKRSKPSVFWNVNQLLESILNQFMESRQLD